MSNLPSPPYTEATVELVAKALWEQAWPPAPNEVGRPARPTPTCYEDARGVLDALVKAGLLLPEGAETRTEYGVEHTYPGQEPIGLPATSRVAAERSVAVPNEIAQRRVVERTVWFTPWRPVDAVRLAEGDSSKEHA